MFRRRISTLKGRSRMGHVWRYLLVGVLIIGLGGSYLAITSPDVVLVDIISAPEWGAPPIPNWKIEDIVMCENGTEAWAWAVGPGPFNDFLLFKIIGISTPDPGVDQDSFIPFLSPLLGGEFPSGIGAHDYPGLTVNVACDTAYFPNSFLDTVTSVDLKTGEIRWDMGVPPEPVDVELTYPDNGRIIVTNSVSGVVTVLDADTGDILAEIAVGFEPTGIAVVGNTRAFILTAEGVACLDLTTLEVGPPIWISVPPGVIPIAPLPPAKSGFQILVDNAGQWVYISHPLHDMVTVMAARGCELSWVGEIPVGDHPRYMALSPDDKFLYVSNAIDKTVSVIDTDALAVKTTIRVLDLICNPPFPWPLQGECLKTEEEPAPLGMVAVSKDNRHLFVYWEGGVIGTPGAFQLLYLDVSNLYEDD